MQGKRQLAVAKTMLRAACLVASTTSHRINERISPVGCRSSVPQNLSQSARVVSLGHITARLGHLLIGRAPRSPSAPAPVNH